MKIIKQIYKIKASAKAVWAALVEPKHLAGWGAGPAKMSAREGDKFSIWGGQVWGKNVKVSPLKKLVQEWYGGEWDKPSIVEILLSEAKGVTTIKLVHKDLPSDEIDEFTDGWREYYFGPMKEYLEKNKKAVWAERIL